MQTMAFRPSPLPSPSPVAPPPGFSLSSFGSGVAANSNTNLSTAFNAGNSSGRSASGALSTPEGHGPDPVKASVAHLLSRAHGVPCSAAAQAFGQLVAQPARFGIALEMLLPALSGQVEVWIVSFMDLIRADLAVSTVRHRSEFWSHTFCTICMLRIPST